MRRITGRLAIAVGCAIATAAFTGAALAGNGHGSENAPGQQRHDEAAQTTQPASAQGAGAEQQAAGGAAAGTQAGVKPSSSTTKWTHCSTGGAGTGTAACTAEAGTPATKADVSKHYGNGKTAAQIAVGHGAPDGTLVTGPGNSQPHKVTACGTPSNRSGGVDVHAVKSYDASACEASTAQPQHPVQPVVVSHGCGQTATVETCGGISQPVEHPQPVTHPTVTAAPPVTAAPAPAAHATSTSVGQAAGAPAPAAAATATHAEASTASSQSAGGVLGATKTLAKPKPAAGVLGTVSKVTGSTLPFTGFPLWLVLAAALALIGAGAALRQRGSAMRV